jgi:hypothetical protein
MIRQKQLLILSIRITFDNIELYIQFLVQQKPLYNGLEQKYTQGLAFQQLHFLMIGFAIQYLKLKRIL